MLHQGAAHSFPNAHNVPMACVREEADGQGALPASVFRALHTTTETETQLPHTHQHKAEAGGIIPPRLMLSLGDRGSNDKPIPDFKDFITQDHGRRLQDEDDEPLFTPGDAALPFGLLASATSRLPSAHAPTLSGLPQRFALLQRSRMRCRGSRTVATSYQHASAAQALPGRGAVAALHPSPSSPACGNLRHTRCFCCGIFVFKLRSFRMAKARATAKGLHRPVAARWLLKVSAPRRGLSTRLAGCDD